MKQTQLTQLILDQSKDLFWMVDLDFKLVYANKIYFKTIKEATGIDQKPKDDILVEGFGEGHMEKWKAYYKRAFKGECFETEEEYVHSSSNIIKYNQITFEPIVGDDNKIYAVVCQSRDVTRIEKLRAEASRMMDASLDVFCTVNDKGKFLYVSPASLNHWGYTPEELIGKSMQDLILEEDLPKTKEIIKAILGGQEIKSYVNRYKKKDGGIAYNLWSARIDENTQIRYAVAKDCKEKIEQEEKILLSEQRFKALVQEGNDLYAIIDKEGYYIYMSPSSLAIIGIPPETFIGRDAFEFIHPDDTEQALKSLKKVASADKVAMELYRAKNHENEWRWVETVLTNMLDHPAIKGIIINSRDVTDRINHEEILRNSQKRFEALVENSMDAVIIISPEGKTTYVSGSIKNILGYTPAEVMGMNFKEFIHPEDLAASENAVILSLQHPGVPMRGHTGRVKHKNGTWRWIEPVVTNLLEDPSVRGIVDNFKDVTDEIEEKHKLKLFESVITHTKDAVLITEAEPFDEPGPKIVYVNEAFTKMTGYTAAEVIGKTPRILQGPNSDKAEIAKLSKAIKKWEACEITTINYKKNGEEFWINFTITPVANEKGWFTHWIAIERDVTEQKNKELENELLAKISANFNAENDFQNAIIELCKTISEFGKFDWVEFYSLNLEKSQMRLLSHYLADSNDEKLFSYFPGIDTFSKSEGMAGKVWVTETPQLWNVNDAANDFIRRESAIQIGLKTVLGIPLIFNNEIIGVLQVGTKSDINYFNKFLPTFKKLENHIGSELNRKILENELSHLFDTIPDILSLVDFQGKYLRINKAACILLGYSEEEILYHNFNEFIHPDDADLANKELEKLKIGESTFGFEVRFMTKSGEIIWLSWYCVSELNEGLIYSTAKNITEEKKLRELNRQVGQMVKIGSWDLDLISEKLFWSDEVHLLHETDPKIFVPNIESAVNFYREDFREMVLSCIGKSISEGEQFDFEAVIVTPNKKEIWVRSMGNTESVGGKCVRVYGGIQDISERKEAQVRLQSLTENLPGVVFQYLVYPDGTDDVKYVTKGSQEVWGYSSKEVLQNHKLVWERILAGGEIEIIRKSLALSIENKTEWNSRWKYLMPDGELKTHVGHGTPSFLADGTVLLNAVIFDATQETKNKELLEQITKQAKIGSWVTDLVYGEHFLSDVACGILGLETGQTIPDMESTLKYFREDFRANAQAKFMACLETGASFDFEAVIVSTDKNEKWVRTIGSAEMINNVCRKIYGSLQDISDLKEVESRLRSFSENLPGVVYQYVIHPDETASIKYVSGAVEQLFGYPAHEVMENMDLVWDQVKAGGDYEKIQSSIMESIQMKSKLTNRFRQIMPSGEQKVRIGYGGNPIFMADGNIMFNSILLDITQEAKNEQLLAQASQMARIGSWELDLINPDSNNTYWSPMVLEILEIDESYIPSYSGGLEFYVGESKSRIQKAMDLIITKGVEFDEELLVRTKKGNERWIRCIGKSETTNNIRTKIYGSYQDVDKRKKSEIQLAESENKFRTILEAEPECIKLLDASGNLLMMNSAGLAMIEADSEEQVIGTPVLGILLKEHRAAFTKLSENVFKGEAGILKFEIKGLKGTHRWLETHAVPMKNENGVVVSLLGVTRDITERKKAEESLLNSEQKNTLIMNSAMDAIICIDTKGDVIFWNPESENIFGWKQNEIMGQKLSNYIIPENFKSKHDKGMEHYMKSGEAKMFNNMVELSAINKSGETFPIELTVIPIKQGNEEFFCAFIRDITQRKISEERILNANERFEKVTEATNDVIWDWDIINETFYRSKAIEKFFGKGTSQFLVKKEFWSDKFHPEDLPKIKKSMEESLNNPLSKKWDAEYRIINDKDEIIYVKEKGMIIRDINGKAIRMVGAMTNITEQKLLTNQLNELNQELQKYTMELERSNEELEQFAFVASHDLHEPLRMVSSFMDLLGRKYGDQIDEKGHQYIHFATDGAKRMKQIILDLLEYSRANKPTEGKEKVDLNELLSDFKQLRRKIISEKRAKIISKELPLLTTYKAAITQIFHCLIDNALKYTEVGKAPKVELNVIENENEWEFSVKDNGIGIDPQFYDKIFVIFQRLHNKDKYSGTGIGLSIAKRHIEFLSGRIWLDSTLGEGSIFYFTIPKN